MDSAAGVQVRSASPAPGVGPGVFDLLQRGGVTDPASFDGKPTTIDCTQG